MYPSWHMKPWDKVSSRADRKFRPVPGCVGGN